ncbi:Arginine transport ATP-binding protein ArtM [Pseudovibrio axinellae]|uniref:Arginine transport ATP-binding protein ArtM n=1 Tax=Pseudovibrio axinellae TaxID=989403 RepID=A0A165ZG97_9HYPH|nr:ABC transporter ATP-binding protein [Pseudovibrio axinellae]KZL19866.1 Arginine transport ATP-binding protein ArtM [Pseudovibrio axinellae]SER38750.1 amino acid/amide ABC transporter ATP-binding protein 1, HAAT family [Pseudovibrio axinellae]
MMKLRVAGLKQYFGGLKAVDTVSLDAKQSEILAIIGPNGAGKTTVINAITGLRKPTAGTVWLGDKTITGLAANRIAELGIARTFQNIELFEHASVLDNIQLGFYRHRKVTLCAELFNLPSARAEAVNARLAAEKILHYLDLVSWRDKAVSGLSYGIRKQVELGRALCSAPSFLILDEPASGLTREETLDLGYFLRDLAKNRGIGILMIEHDMGLVSRVADHVIAMNEGRILAKGSAPEVQSNADVIECYLGSEMV